MAAGFRHMIIFIVPHPVIKPIYTMQNNGIVDPNNKIALQVAILQCVLLKTLTCL